MNTAELKKGYLFHTEWDDGDADKSLFGHCPELVRVDNCSAWRPMSSVLNLVPRVVHPSDVKAREFHVAGRDLHFVCGVFALCVWSRFWIQKHSTSSLLYVPRGNTRCRNLICKHHVGACGIAISRYKGGYGKERECAFRIVFNTMDICMHGFL